MRFNNYSLDKQKWVIRFFTVLSNKEWTKQHKVSEIEFITSRKEYKKRIRLYKKLIKN